MARIVLMSSLALAVGTCAGKEPATQSPEPAPPVASVAVDTPAPKAAPVAAAPAADASAELAAAPDFEDAEGAEPEALPDVEVPDLDDKVRERILAVQALVVEKANKHGVDPALLNAMIWVESKFDPKARGPAGAQGLMQLMPKTARSLAGRLERKSKPYDPDFNIDAGALYLARLLRRFDGDEALALAAYNRGVGRVAGWVEAGEEIPERTLGYIERVQGARDWLRVFVAQEAASDALAQPPEPAPIDLAQGLSAWFSRLG